MSASWTLGDGVKQNRKYPDTFHIPSDTDKALLEPGDFVKLMFGTDGDGERMWVKIMMIGAVKMAGTLASNPAFTDGLQFGDVIVFRRDNIINTQFADAEATAG